jgi:hypothetical protein
MGKIFHVSVKLVFKNIFFCDEYLARYAHVRLGLHVMSSLNMSDINKKFLGRTNRQLSFERAHTATEDNSYNSSIVACVFVCRGNVLI